MSKTNIQFISSCYNFNKVDHMFFDFFSSREEKEAISHIKNLIFLASVDGKVHENELASILLIAKREGVSDININKLINNPERTDFLVPYSLERQEQYLKDLVLCMMSDGNIEDREVNFCKSVARIYGYRVEVIDAIILKYLNELKENLKSI